QTRRTRDDPRELQGWRGAVGRRHRRYVPIYFATLSEAMSQANSGAVRLLAVSSEKRVPQIANIPTFAESGFPGFKALTWNGLMAPSAMPKETIDRIAKRGVPGRQGRDLCRATCRVRCRPARQHPQRVRGDDRGGHRLVGGSRHNRRHPTEIEQ